MPESDTWKHAASEVLPATAGPQSNTRGWNEWTSSQIRLTQTLQTHKRKKLRSKLQDKRSIPITFVFSSDLTQSLLVLRIVHCLPYA